MSLFIHSFIHSYNGHWSFRNHYHHHRHHDGNDSIDTNNEKKKFFLFDPYIWLSDFSFYFVLFHWVFIANFDGKIIPAIYPFSCCCCCCCLSDLMFSVHVVGIIIIIIVVIINIYDWISQIRAWCIYIHACTYHTHTHTLTDPKE